MIYIKCELIVKVIMEYFVLKCGVSLGVVGIVILFCKLL